MTLTAASLSDGLLVWVGLVFYRSRVRLSLKPRSTVCYLGRYGGSNFFLLFSSLLTCRFWGLFCSSRLIISVKQQPVIPLVRFRYFSLPTLDVF